MVKQKLRAGKGAKAEILTRMIIPKQPAQQDKNHRSSIYLLDRFFDEKGKLFYRFRYNLDDEDGMVLHSSAHWVKITEEGKKEDLFDPGLASSDVVKITTASSFKEPSIKWANSKAKKILYKDIMKGLVPITAKDENGKSTMELKDIYSMHPEYAEYDYEKFSSRLSSLRKTIAVKDARAEADQIAVDLFIKNRDAPSLFSSKGYIQWQGSEAQKKVRLIIKEKTFLDENDKFVGYRMIYESDETFHDEFPYKAFRDKFRQEIRTGKYLYTLKIKGKQHKAS